MQSETRDLPTAPRGNASNAEVRAIDRDGVAVLTKFLDGGELESAITAVGELEFDSQATRTRRGAPFARRNLLHSALVEGLVALPKVRALLAEVAPGTIPVRAILFDKNAEANWTVPWHQDRSIAVAKRNEVPGFGPWSEKSGVVHVQPPESLLKQMMTLRFSLDACDDTNGPLRVIPGTHNRLLAAEEVEQIAAKSPQRACTTDAGGLVIMRPLILHASSPASAPRNRRVVHIELGPCHLPGGLQWALV